MGAIMSHCRSIARPLKQSTLWAEGTKKERQIIIIYLLLNWEMSIVGGRFESIVLLYIRKCKNLYEWNIELMFYFCVHRCSWCCCCCHWRFPKYRKWDREEVRGRWWIRRKGRKRHGKGGAWGMSCKEMMETWSLNKMKCSEAKGQMGNT